MILRTLFLFFLVLTLPVIARADGFCDDYLAKDTAGRAKLVRSMLVEKATSDLSLRAMNVADRLTPLTGEQFIVDMLRVAFDSQCARADAGSMRDFNAGNMWGRIVEQLDNGEMLKVLLQREKQAVDLGLIPAR